MTSETEGSPPETRGRVGGHVVVNFYFPNVLGYRPVTRGGARGAFAPSPQAPKDRILILNIEVKECSRLN